GSAGRDTILRLCVVVAEVTVSSRPSRVVGSVRIMQPSSIACAKSSRMQPLPVSGEADPSVRRLAAVPAATSPAFPPPRIAIRAPRLGTWKKPPNSGALAAGLEIEDVLAPSGPGFRGSRSLGLDRAV